VNPSVDQLREEHRRLVIGPELARLLERIVRATAPVYPATEYGEPGGWNGEALEDLLHDWISERLLGRGDLAVMLRTASSSASLRGALTTSLSQFVINRRRRTSASNLYRRTLSMLRSDADFDVAGGRLRSSDQLWTLASAPQATPSTRWLSQLVQTAEDLTDEHLGVVRYGPFSLKSSPILREPALGEFLRYLLERADGALPLSTIAEVMRRRFRLFELGDVEIDESFESADTPIPQRVEHEVAAASVVARMGAAGAVAIRAFEESDGDFSAAGSALGSDTRAGEAAVTMVIGLIADHATSTDDARAIYAAVLERLF
jgi:hypothetical protein